MNKEVRLNNFEFSIIMPIDLNRRAIDILKKIKDIIKQLPNNIESHWLSFIFIFEKHIGFSSLTLNSRN